MYTCNHCMWTFLEIALLRRHLGDGDLIPFCRICNVTFPCWSVLNSHVHPIGPCFTCTQCASQFSTKDALMIHLRFPCTGCSKKFCRLDDLSKHLCHKCPGCSHHFCSTFYLEKHVNKCAASNVQYHQCTQCSHPKCSTNFCTKQALRKHLPSHKNTEQRSTFPERTLTLGSVDSDLSLLCNFLGSDSRTETRI